MFRFLRYKAWLAAFKTARRIRLDFLKTSRKTNGSVFVSAAAGSRDVSFWKSTIAPRTYTRSPKFNLRHKLCLGQFNCRTLSSRVRQQELVNLLDNAGVDALAIQEHRLKLPDPTQTAIKCLEKGWILVYTSSWGPRSAGGVGILLSPRLSPFYSGALSVSPRILRILLSSAPKPLVLYSVYSPTAVSAHEDDVEEFYDCLTSVIERDDPSVPSCILGDFNAVLLKGQGGCLFAPSGEKSNLNSDSFCSFVEANNLRPVSRCFQKKRHKLLTFNGLKGRKACLDYILTTCKWKRSATDYRIIHSWPIVSDHRIIAINFKLRLRSAQKSPFWSPRIADTSSLGRCDSLDAAVDALIIAELSKLEDNPRSGLPLTDELNAVMERIGLGIAALSPYRKRKKEPPDRQHPLIVSARLACQASKTSRPLPTLAATYKAVESSRIENICQDLRVLFGDNLHSAACLTVKLFGPKKILAAKSPSGSTLRSHFSAYLSSANSQNANSSLMAELNHPPGTRCLSISSDELDSALKGSRSYSCPGRDGIPTEVLKRVVLRPFLLQFFNHVLESGEIPKCWREAVILPLHKKGNPALLENYRGIALMSSMGKLYDKLLLNKLRRLLDPKLDISLPKSRRFLDRHSLLRPSQAGFRCGRSCAEQTLALRLILEACQVYQTKSVVITFIDFSKAFDSLSRPYIVLALKELNVPLDIIKATMGMYVDFDGFVVGNDGLSAPFSIDNGVLQGDTLAPFLFIVALNRILSKALDGPNNNNFGFHLRERKSSRQPALRVTDLAFADDIALVAETFESAQAMLDAVVREASIAGLHLNQAKTKVLVKGDLAFEFPSRTLQLLDSDLERVSDFRYLGSSVISPEVDICSRQTSAQLGFAKLRSVWAAPIPIKLKAQVFKLVIEPILFFGCESWVLTETLTRKISAAWFRLLRWALGIRWQDKVRNEEVLFRAGLSRDPTGTLRERFLMFLGHMLRARSRSLGPNCPTTPLSTILLWNGDANSCYSQTGSQNFRLVQRRGQGNRLTYLRYCSKLLGLSATDGNQLEVLANSREAWIQLVMSNLGGQV